MGRHERRHSVDYFTLPYNNYSACDATSTSRKVHFDDEMVDYMNTCKPQKSNSKECLREAQLNVQEITAKLKHSYGNISHGLEVLGKVYHDLRKTKGQLNCTQDRTVCQTDIFLEIERLLGEVEKLKESLERNASRKRRYLEELSRLQSTLHSDRKKMESWSRTSQNSNKKLKSKIDESSKLTRDQQILIQKLKNDNASLWKILQEIQLHLREDQKISHQLASAGAPSDVNSFLTPKQLLKLPEPKRETFDFTCDIYEDGSSTQNSARETKSSDDVSSTTSSQDQYLCDKLKQLLEQSDNIQKMISNVGSKKDQNNYKFSDTGSKSSGSEQSSEIFQRCSDRQSNRIPSENERGERSDLHDIIKRCEELEKKVEKCSAKGLRDRIMLQLHEIDTNEYSSENSEKIPCERECVTKPSTFKRLWPPEQHRHVRSELLKCLDQIVCLEENFLDAQNEIHHLRNYIKESGEEKEFAEKSFKREAIDLRKVTEEQRNEISDLKLNLQDALKELKQSEMLITKFEEKNFELEKLRVDMNSAIEAVGRIRLNTTESSHIQGELNMLQVAISEIEGTMQLIQEHNLAYQADADSKDRLVQELEVDNDELIERLQICENENSILLVQLEIAASNGNCEKFNEKDNQIKELQEELKKSKEKLDAFTQLQELTGEIAIDKNKEDEKVEVISTLINDNNNYVEMLQEKDDTIAALQKDLNCFANKLEESFSAKKEDGAEKKDETTGAVATTDISQELDTIKQMLDASHSDLADKVLSLHKELNKLRSENQTLRKQVNNTNPELHEQSSDLLKQNEKLKDENATLRDTLNRPYPGIVENILSQGKDIKDLHEENELLRLALNNDRKALVDSNLRKRTRIKELEERVDDLQQHKQRRTSESQGSHEKSIASLERGGKVSPMQEKDNKFSRHDNKKAKDNDGGEVEDAELIEALNKQSGIIGKLQNEKRKLKQLLSCNEGKLKQDEQARIALQNELSSLRTTLKEIGKNEDSGRSQVKIKELEDEVKRLQRLQSGLDEEDAVTPTPDRKNLHLPALSHDAVDVNGLPKSHRAKMKKLFIENNKLKEDLEKSHENNKRLTTIAERNQHNASVDQLHKTRMKKMDEKLKRVDDENVLLRDNMKDMEETNKHAESEIMYLKSQVESANVKAQEFSEEVNKLRFFIKDLHNQKKEENEDDGMVNILNQTVQNLQNQIEKLQQQYVKLDAEKHRVDNEFSSLKLNQKSSIEKHLREQEREKDSIQRNLLSSNEELQQSQEKRKELQEICAVLTEELEKVRTDVTEKDFSSWLQQDSDRRFELLTPESHRSELNSENKEKQLRRDQVRIIRKLQIENQQLNSKLSCLEDEAVETTKIIADMERGHGHLTGTLRCHLILQSHATEKLLENSLQQYNGDYELLKNSFSNLENKYDKQKQFSKRRDHAWDLFTNASATIVNIQTILNEGLVKVEEDLVNDVSDFDFENKDYKSRLWILRRRLSDVENRHRELLLRAEELNVRLDAKTTEYQVTQDELEDTTRDLESRESSLQKLKDELHKLSIENGKLKDLMLCLKDNQDKTVGVVLSENNALQKAATNRDSQIKTIESDISEMLVKLDEKDSALNVMKQLRKATEQELEKLKNRIQYLEKKLKEMTAQKDKLKKEAENRAGYMANCNDDHGTIHLLRDDIKRLAKENAKLKEDIVLRQRQMYDMSKDLHRLNMEKDLDASFNRQDRPASRNRDEFGAKMIQDLAELKAQKFLLETKLKDMARRNVGEVDESIDEFFDKAFKSKLIEREKEIEKLKREKTSTKGSKSPNASRDDTMSDVNLSVLDSSHGDQKVSRDIRREHAKLKGDLQLLQNVIKKNNLQDRVEVVKKQQEFEQVIDQQKAEVDSLSRDVEIKSKKIKELLKAIDGMKDEQDGKPRNPHSARLSKNEKKSVDDQNKRKEEELLCWKEKAEELEKEIQLLRSRASADDKFPNTYLHRTTPNSTGAPTPHEGFLDRNTPQNPEPNQNTGVDNLINLEEEPMYMELQPYVEMTAPSNAYSIPKPSKLPVGNGSPKKELSPTSESTAGSKIPVAPKRKISPPTDYEEPVDRTDGGNKKKEEYIKKVNNLTFRNNQLTDELDLYRTKLGLTEYDNLEILGTRALHSVIDYQLHFKLSDELANIRKHVDQLQKKNEELRAKLRQVHTNNLDNTVTAPVNSRSLGLQEKLNLTVDENSTLKDLLETQSQNVQSQEIVIRTLKTDIRDHKQRNSEDHGQVLQELKERKIEVKNLKKQVKENAKVLQGEKNKWKHDIKLLKAKLKGEEKLRKTIGDQVSTIESLNLTVDQLRQKMDFNDNVTEAEIQILNKSLTTGSAQHQLLLKSQEENLMALKEKDKEIKKLQEKLKDKDTEYEVALKQAESTLEDAKHKISDQIEEKSKLEEENSLILKQKDDAINELREELSAKDNEYEIVLKHAESALEDAKRKITEQKEDNRRINQELQNCESEMDSMKNELKHESEADQCKDVEELKQQISDEHEKYALLENELKILLAKRSADQQEFDRCQQNLKNSLLAKNNELEKMKMEFEKLKVESSEETERLRKDSADLEKQSSGYKILMKRNESTESELALAKSKMQELQDELLSSAKSMSELCDENSKLLSQVDTLFKANAILEDEKVNVTLSVPADTSNMELEVEYEIVKGCNEELEQQVEDLQAQIAELETALTDNQNDLIQTKEDLEKTLGYLQELSKKNEGLEAKHTELEKENSELKSLVENVNLTRKTELKELETLLQGNQTKIEKDHQLIGELEDVIDQLENDVLQKDKETDQLREMTKEKDNLIGQLNSTIKNTDEQLQKEKTRSHSLENEVKNMQDGISQKRNEVDEITRARKDTEKQNEDRVNQLQNEVEILQNSLNISEQEKCLKVDEIKSLKHSLNEWTEKTSHQAELINKLKVEEQKLQKKISKFTEQKKAEDEIEAANLKIIENLKNDLAKKSTLIKSLQAEIGEKESQQSKLLGALNRRREESKAFISMQDKMQNELESKEDLIRKLKFKLKSNQLDITNSSMDNSNNSLDEVDNVFEFDAELEEEVLGPQDRSEVIENQKQSLSIMADQLENLRKRNKKLTVDLEKFQSDYIVLHHEHEKLKRKSNDIEIELQNTKDKLQESREIIHESPNNSFGDETKSVGIKAKLYSAYKELREKSIEVATLKMSMEIKDLELESLEKELKQINDRSAVLGEYKQPDHEFKCNHSTEIKALAREITEKENNEQELQQQIAELRNLYMEKTEKCDSLQNELGKVVGRLRGVELRLLQEDKALKEQFFAEQNSDLSEITPITATSLSKTDDETTKTYEILGNCNDTVLIDGFTDSNEITLHSKQNTNKIEELEKLNLQQNEENLYLQEQIKELRNETQKVKNERKRNMNEIEQLQTKLRTLEETLTQKDIELQQLKNKPTDATVTDTYELNELAKELNQCKLDNKQLQHQLSVQKKNHEKELEHLKATLSQVKEEHIDSLKTDLEKNFKEKEKHQLKIKQMEEQLSRNGMKINELLLENKTLKGQK